MKAFHYILIFLVLILSLTTVQAQDFELFKVDNTEFVSFESGEYVKQHIDFDDLYLLFDFKNKTIIREYENGKETTTLFILSHQNSIDGKIVEAVVGGGTFTFTISQNKKCITQCVGSSCIIYYLK